MHEKVKLETFKAEKKVLQSINDYGSKSMFTNKVIQISK